MLKIQGVPIIEPDYRKSVHEVYIDATAGMMRPDLHALNKVFRHQNHEMLGEYPSWVSSWDEESMRKIGAFDVGIHEESHFAGPRREWLVDQNLACSGVLRLQRIICGTVLDTIRLEMETFDKAVPEPDFVRGLQEPFKQLWSRVGDCDSWTLPNLVELAMTMTAGYIATATHITEVSSDVQQEFMSTFVTFARLVLLANVHMSDELLSSASTDMLAYSNLSEERCQYASILQTTRDWLCLGYQCVKPDDLLVDFDNGHTP